MQKSFIASLALSFVLAFSVVAYLSSPFTIHIETARASAQEVPEVSTTPAIPFSDLNIITLNEIPSSLAPTSTTSRFLATPIEPAWQNVQPAQVNPIAKKAVKQTVHPVRLIIPSIGLNAPIESVGLNSKGEMDVPDGSSPNVGWYRSGTIPGNVGSAVIDAHVYAAFEQLRHVKVGSEIFVENANGEQLKFVVDDSRVYQLGELTSGMLFGRRDARRLNLITCAGQPTADGSTYTHRLVVYTTLVA